MWCRDDVDNDSLNTIYCRNKCVVKVCSDCHAHALTYESCLICRRKTIFAILYQSIKTICEIVKCYFSELWTIFNTSLLNCTDKYPMGERIIMYLLLVIYATLFTFMGLFAFVAVGVPYIVFIICYVVQDIVIFYA